ncbi:MAG: hypothetical protein ACPGGB_09575 [Flavobacteriales bacterium]
MLPGLFRTLVGLVVAWFVFRFLDRLFGGRRRPSASRGGGASARGARGGAAGSGGGFGAGSGAGPQKPAKDDHLGEYVEFEEVDDGKD